jgi:DNA-binding transcriptional ArsR family regulator
MSKRRRQRIERHLAGAALLFAALADETRLTLLQRLSDAGPTSISTLAGSLGVMSRQALTKHLRVLADAGIVEGHREGREHLWALHPGGLAEAQRSLARITRGWDDALSRLKSHVERT